MANPRTKAGAAARLPPEFRALFWDDDFASLNWEADQDLLIGRILAAGDWTAIRWLYHRLGNQALREWLEHRQGAGLSPAQLRFWEVILQLPHRQVSAWINAPARRVWDRRAQG